MTVRELIEKLEALDCPDYQVHIGWPRGKTGLQTRVGQDAWIPSGPKIVIIEGKS